MVGLRFTQCESVERRKQLEEMVGQVTFSLDRMEGKLYQGS